MMNICFKVHDLTIERCDDREITSDSSNFVRCCFDFSGECWENANKFAIFTHDSQSHQVPLQVDETGELYCYIPGCDNAFPAFDVGVYGYDYIENGDIRSFYTNAVGIWNIKSCKGSDLQSELPKDITAKNVPYNNSLSGLNSVNLQDVIDEIVEKGVGNAIESITFNGSDLPVIDKGVDISVPMANTLDVEMDLEGNNYIRLLDTSLNELSKTKLPFARSAPSNISLVNDSGGTALTFAQGTPANIIFTFSSLENDTPTGDGTCVLRVNGEIKTSFGISQGQNTIDVTQYLSSGTNAVEVTCYDTYGNSRMLSYTVDIINLTISSTFDDSLVYDGDITFKFTPYGLVEKTVYFKVDGTVINTMTISASGRQSTITLPGMPHGAHKLEVYMVATVGGNTIVSNTLTYDVVCVESGETDVIIASPFTVTTATQGELLNIPFIVYDPQNLNSEVTLTISSNGETYSTALRTVDRTRQMWSTRQYPSGTVNFTISCGGVSKTHTLTVAESEIDVQAVTNDLELHLSSAGRSNSEQNPAVWADGTVTTAFNNVNFNTTGWIQDSSGDTALRLFGGATALIDFKPFASDFRTYGKTIELEFAIRDVNNRDAVVLSCMSGGIGIEITADKAVLKSEQSQVECRFKDEEKLRVAFVIESRSEYRLMSVYLNGILSGTCQYPDNDNFEQALPVGITVGSPLCGIDLYTIRSYNTALSYVDITNNYIADTTDLSKKAELYDSNNIYDNYGNLSYDLVKSKIPVMTIIGDMPQSKGDKKNVRVIFEDPFHPDLNFDTVDDDGACQIDVQGTSSQWYVRKNWKLKFKNSHTHAVGMLPAKVFCMKADYAEATGTHNTQNANLAHTLYTDKTPPQIEDERYRTTVYGFPCVIFQKENENAEPVFSGKYNFNYDKGAENVFGFSQDYPNAQSWEFLNNTSDACLFHDNIDTDNWGDDFEARYPDGHGDISVFKTMHDFVVSTYQDGATNEELSESYTDIDGTTHTADNAAYRLAKFKTEFTQHFNLPFCLLYYVYTFVMLMVDQRAKNMFLTTWDGVHFEPWLYDNDTCLGIDNRGVLIFDYYHEDSDTLNGAKVYSGQTSALWVNFKVAFADEIKALYQSLRSDKKLSYDVIIDYFVTHGSDMWSASIYNEDSVFKYISMLQSDNDSSNLFQVRGSGESHLKYFVDNRLKYCDSKWYARDYADDYVLLTIYTPSTWNGVEPNADITVTPFSNMYAGVKYKANGTLQQIRATKNVPVTFIAPDETFNVTETSIFGASQISSLGDLAPLYCGSVNVSKASKLTTLKVGDSTEGYSNGNLTELSVGTNKLLKVIDVRNCPNLTAPLALSNCPNIEEIYASGTGITGVELPSSGYLKVLQLPGTLTNLTVLNQQNITTFSCPSYANLTTLRIENCVNIPIGTILSGAVNLSRVRLIGVNLTMNDASLLISLMSKGGLDENGNNTQKSVITGIVHISQISQHTLGEIESCYPDLTVTYDTLIPSYTVTFVNYDDTVIDTQFVEQGSAPDEPEITSTKPQTISETYTFDGWSWENSDTIIADLSAVSIGADTTFHAHYTASPRTYTVRWYNGNTLLATQAVNYGESAEYSGDIPVNPHDGDYATYYLFKGWDKSTGVIKEDMDVYAQYDSAVMPLGKTLSQMTPADLNVLVKTGILSPTGENNTYVASGDTIDIIAGHDFNFDNVDSHELVSLSNPQTFDGTNCFKPQIDGEDVTLFDMDKSFTLVIDFAFDTTTAAGSCLASCYDDNGFLLRYASGGSVRYGESSARAVSSNGVRQVTVIRKIAGDSNLYVYGSNKNGNNIVYSALAQTNAPEHSAPLCFGAQMIEDESVSNNAIGTVYWSKLWDDDLGDTVCRELAAWPRQTFKMQAVGSSERAFRNFKRCDNGEYVNCAFMLKDLLEETHAVNPSGRNAGGWKAMPIRTWLNARILNALPITWQQLILTVYVHSNAGNATLVDPPAEDYIWLPCCKDVGFDTTTSPYSLESDATFTVFTNDASRIKRLNFGAGAASIYWLRSPHSNVNSHYRGVSTSGKYGISGSFDGKGMYTDYSYGVAFGFCI